MVGDRFISIATDRISAFDHILPEAIPHKGQVLNQTASYFLEATRDIVPNWLETVPDANVSIGKRCQPIKLEMVIRGHLSGHAWRTYRSGQRILCGAEMPEGMRENDPFPDPIITPATKADEGHDEDISREQILQRDIVTDDQLILLERYTRQLFDRGRNMALARGLILVDTKYEFGFYNDEIYLIDEIHTPDSSRYFIAEGFEDRQSRAQPQEQLSKEFVREWLIRNEFQGREGDRMPQMPADFIQSVSDRYIDLYQRVTGNEFIRRDTSKMATQIEESIRNYLE